MTKWFLLSEMHIAVQGGTSGSNQVEAEHKSTYSNQSINLHEVQTQSRVVVKSEKVHLQFYHEANLADNSLRADSL